MEGWYNGWSPGSDHNASLWKPHQTKETSFMKLFVWTGLVYIANFVMSNNDLWYDIFPTCCYSSWCGFSYHACNRIKLDWWPFSENHMRNWNWHIRKESNFSTNYMLALFNTVWPILHLRTSWQLVHILACHLFGAKPFLEPMMNYLWPTQWNLNW